MATSCGIVYADTISSGKCSAHTNLIIDSWLIFLLIAKFHAKDLFLGTLNRVVLVFLLTLEHSNIEHFRNFILDFLGKNKISKIKYQIKYIITLPILINYYLACMMAVKCYQEINDSIMLNLNTR